ncbi:hypothetical protein DFH06DRAFT_1127502 [Mycena polygramma]|nr:hypothetical protein DFH06DRAFT_1127502 [Mycena polygramma]
MYVGHPHQEPGTAAMSAEKLDGNIVKKRGPSMIMKKPTSCFLSQRGMNAECVGNGCRMNARGVTGRGLFENSSDLPTQESARKLPKIGRRKLTSSGSWQVVNGRWEQKVATASVLESGGRWGCAAAGPCRERGGLKHRALASTGPAQDSADTGPTQFSAGVNPLEPRRSHMPSLPRKTVGYARVLPAAKHKKTKMGLQKHVGPASGVPAGRTGSRKVIVTEKSEVSGRFEGRGTSRRPYRKIDVDVLTRKLLALKRVQGPRMGCTFENCGWKRLGGQQRRCTWSLSKAALVNERLCHSSQHCYAVPERETLVRVQQVGKEPSTRPSSSKIKNLPRTLRPTRIALRTLEATGSYTVIALSGIADERNRRSGEHGSPGLLGCEGEVDEAKHLKPASRSSDKVKHLWCTKGGAESVGKGALSYTRGGKRRGPDFSSLVVEEETQGLQMFKFELWLQPFGDGAHR